MTKTRIRATFHRIGLLLSCLIVALELGIVWWMVSNSGADILAELGDPAVLTKIVILLFVAFAGCAWGACKLADLAGRACAVFGRGDAPGGKTRRSAWRCPLGWLGATFVAWLACVATLKLGHPSNVALLAEFPAVFLLVFGGAYRLPRRPAQVRVRAKGGRHVPLRP